MQARRKNMERMEEVVPASDYQSLHHFLSASDWDTRAVLDQVAVEVDRHLGGAPDSCLLLDETSFPKKGNQSVGVARQWCGRLGKLENCQVAVFASLAQGPHATLIDTRLYLPKEWTANQQRCRAAGIPEEECVTKSKSELALEMVARARQNKVRFTWVVADGNYGQCPAFLRSLEDRGELFVMDVHKNQRIYLEDPEPCLGERLGKNGKKQKGLLARSESVEVKDWLKAQPAGAWQEIRVRPSSRGELRVEVLHRRVWLWDGHEVKARCWHLIVSREVGLPETTKFALSNASTRTSLRRLVQIHRQRFWIERCFEDGKGECGLGDYQVRGWLAWHHHMALAMMAMLFLLEERLSQKEAYPLLSCSDIEVLLAHFLPRRDGTPEEVVRQMEARHRARQRAIDSAYRRQEVQDRLRRGNSYLTK